MTGFNVRTANLRAINSITKYPSIPTYHTLDSRNGGLLEERVPFTGPVIGTEKVDGTNARVIVLPDGSYLLGSREELLYAQGDLLGNPALGIAEALRPLADARPLGDLDGIGDPGTIRVLYLEVYGWKIGGAAKHYTRTPQVGWRLFDVALIEDWAPMLDWPAERISAWREAGGQTWAGEERIAGAATAVGADVTPRLLTVDAAALPADVEATRAWLAEHAPATRVALDGAEPGMAEGVVLRTPDRSVIAKARFQDYDRTLRRRAKAGR
jgi:hypothetical protein